MSDRRFLFYNIFISLLISIIINAISFYFQGHVGFNLWDEGFLWYGVQRVMSGEVPIRDFMAYDPGRYYWSAAIMRLFSSSGIMQLRLSVAAFQVIGLFCGVLLVYKSLNKINRFNLFYLTICALTMFIWMYPRHKLFDISLSIILISVLSFLVHKPVKYRYFLSGLFLGFVAVFGKNHGMYGLLGSLGVIAYVFLNNKNYRDFFKTFLIWFSGLIIGYSPIIIMSISIQGFAKAFWNSIRFLFESKSTNLPLPIPWPWTEHVVQLPFEDALRGVLVGSFFIVIVAFGIAGLAFLGFRLIKKKVIHPVLVSAIFLSIPYAQYAYSRADVGHLAHGIFPFLIGSFIFLDARKGGVKWVFSLIICCSSFLVMYQFHPGWQYFKNKENFVEVKISGSKLKVDRGTASDIVMLTVLVDKYAIGDRTFIATPFWPGAYAVFNRKSPMWEIYALFPRSESFEMGEVERIKFMNPAFAVIFNLPLDGREDLRFCNTHPLIDRYIMENFDPVTGVTNNSAYQIYRGR